MSPAKPRRLPAAVLAVLLVCAVLCQSVGGHAAAAVAPHCCVAVHRSPCGSGAAGCGRLAATRVAPSGGHGLRSTPNPVLTGHGLPITPKHGLWTTPEAVTRRATKDGLVTIAIAVRHDALTKRNPGIHSGEPHLSPSAGFIPPSDARRTVTSRSRAGSATPSGNRGPQAGNHGGTYDAVAFKLASSGSGLLYSTYLGGNGADVAAALALDGAGNIYLTGYTSSSDFPGDNAVQLRNAGGASDAFLSVLHTGGASLRSSTVLGGSGQDLGNGVAVDSSGSAYLNGFTTSSDFPTANPYQGSLGAGGTSIVMAKVANPSTPPSPTPITMRVSYSYDAANRRTSLTYPDGQQESWGYDAAGRINQVTQPGAASHTWTVSHDGANNLTQLLAANGGKQTWSYDNAGRNTSTSWLAGSTTIFSQTATLDAAGQRTTLLDSAGTTSYGYDLAGRLNSASYPDGSSEADTYDPAGNRATITNTVGLTTTVTTNTLDAADQLTSGSVRVNGGTAAVTSYSYDGNGNQLGSAGATGIVTNTYNLQNQLVHVSGPNTNSSYVYDGQGDRLRSYEQYPTVPILHNEAQDLVGGSSGLSSMVWDGQADYAYLTPGAGQAPLARYDQATLRTTTLATDLLGSVRLATDPSDATIGAGTYDAWGNARANPGGSGATLLAGLQASSPFGFAGQQYDAGPGAYAMRARTYSPGQGRFQSQDPLPYDPQVPVTINPYEYAGNMPTDVTDPSGQGWLPRDYTTWHRDTDALYEASIAIGLGLNQSGSSVPTGRGMAESEVSIYPAAQNCAHGIHRYVANLVLADSATVGGSSFSGQVWDIEHVQAFRGNPGPLAIASGIQSHLIDGARTRIDWVVGSRCDGQLGDRTDCGGAVTQMHADLRFGGDFTQAFGAPTASGGAGAGTKKLVRVIPVFSEPNRIIIARSGGPGVIAYDVIDKPPPCKLGLSLFGCMFNRMVVEPYQVIRNDSNWLHKGVAAVGLFGLGHGALRGVFSGVKILSRGRGSNALGIVSDGDTLESLGPDGIDKAIEDTTGDASAEAAYANDLILSEVSSGDAEAAVVEGESGAGLQGAVAEANFTQNSIRSNEAFSEQGQTKYSLLSGTPIWVVNDMVNALRDGRIKPSQVPLDYVEMNGVRLILNTRTSTALQRAGIPKNEWYGIDQTGETAHIDDITGRAVTFNELAQQQLKRNKLPPTGSPTIKG